MTSAFVLIFKSYKSKTKQKTLEIFFFKKEAKLFVLQTHRHAPKKKTTTATTSVIRKNKSYEEKVD